MTKISPLLQNQIQEQKRTNNEHERVYEDLRKHANDVHPNAPKAKLINEGPLESVVSYIKDTKQDFVNLDTTVRTGKMTDNNLGRLNDLGMKIGGLLIASYLAIHSKSKNEAAMKFIGTGAFFASMKLWPKIFIFGPAKLMHKVDPGKRYVSAHGDKKDFYLDNQFIPWDITPIKDEKEQRRHQKVALQNRTLWMASAGASVPLMTALISNRLEPVVARAIALLSANKINRHGNNIDEYIKSAKPIVKHEEEIEKLCKQYKNNPTDVEFAKKLSKYLRINDLDFKDPDWVKTINDFSVTNFHSALEELWKEKAEITISKENFEKSIRSISYKVPENITSMFSENGDFVKAQGKRTVEAFSEAEINNVMKALFGENKNATFTYKQLEEVLKDNIKSGTSTGSELIQSWLKRLSWKNDGFFASIKDYNKNVVSVVRGRLSKYLKIANPAYGSNADSIYTNAYERTMKNLFKRLNYSVENPDSPFYKVKDFIKINLLGQEESVVKATQHLSLKDVVEKDKDLVTKSLSDYFSALVKDVDFESPEYNHIIEELTKSQLTPKEQKALEIISRKANIKNIKKANMQPALDRAVFGGRNSSITNILSLYAKEQKTNINAIISRLAMCANFEARLKEGKILVDGVDIRELPDSLKVAKSLMYEGNVSQTVVNNSAGTINTANYLKIVDALYSKEAFENEPQIVKESASKILNYIKKNSDFNATDKYLANSDLYGLVKDYAARLYPSMKWMKKAGIASAVIVGITLLLQPLFGKLKKEFPNNKPEKGGND